MKGRRVTYSKEELLWLRENCQLPRKEALVKFCEKFNRDVSFDNLKALYTRKGWKTGRTGCFEKGEQVWNKGKKMPFNPNSAKTQFKKGHKPLNAKYLGHERITKDGYVEISVTEKNPHTGAATRYVLKHKYLWEQKNGKVPKGMCLKCIDSNRQNTDPNNWEAIPRGALPFLNGHRGHNYDNAPEELKPTILTLAKLKQAVSKKSKFK
jgi:hypothetical protein